MQPAASICSRYKEPIEDNFDHEQGDDEASSFDDVEARLSLEGQKDIFPTNSDFQNKVPKF